MENFCKSVEQVQQELNTNIEHGLNEEEIIKKREQYGYNELQEKKNKVYL